jgi:N-acylneuraminate cytidylyltransferase
LIEGKTVLAVIPARGGSKGVQRKNVRPLRGKPLLAWTIEAGKAARLIDRLVVSSEDREILDIARQFDCEVPFVRPLELAQDDTPGMAPIRHAIAELPGYDYTVVLQPTSPLRVSGDIDACVEKCHATRADACVSVTALTKPLQWTYVRRGGDLLEPLLDAGNIEARRQDFDVLVSLNGAVYVARNAWLEAGHSFLDGRVVGYEMPPERSFDIDTEWDLYLVSRVVEGPAFTG